MLDLSITNSILKILNMLDNNLHFAENFVNEEEIKGKRSLVFYGYLDKKPKYCINCGIKKDEKLVKNGTKISKIKIPKVSELKAYLNLKKQRYTCSHCNTSFASTTTIVDYRCHISNNTKQSVINYSKKVMSNLDIAVIHNISNMSVQRINDKVYSEEKLYKHYLPENLCFDEFTYKKKTMAFNFCDADSGKTIDLVEDRKLDKLIKYFKYYLKDTRDKVKHIVIDMYKPYISLINECFPNSKIIIDMFHIVQLISGSLNKTRIMVMKSDKENYRKFKRYWRLLLTSRFNLNCTIWNKYLCFKNLMTEVDIVDYLLEQSDILKASYNLYQNLLYSLQTKDYDLLIKTLNTNYGNISNYMKTTINTLNEFLPYIKNTLENNYSNGVMERNNNTCKLLKRIAFGYRNFKNFKSRILIITNLFRTI